MKNFLKTTSTLLALLLLPSSAFAQAFLCPNTPRAIAAGDFNGDGKLDVAVVRAERFPNSATRKVFIYPGNGTGGLGSPSESQLPFQPSSVVAADFIPGGNFEIVAAPAVFTLIDTFTTLAVGDFDGDGRLDIALADGFTGVSVFLLQANGTFSNPFNDTSVFSGPADIAVGHFNGDGHLDFAVAKKGDPFLHLSPGHEVAIFFGNGAGGFTRQPDIQSGGVGPQSIVAGDFNGDGKLDLAVLHFYSNDVSIFLGNGQGHFSPSAQSPISLPAGDNGASLLALDFNGDGKLDLAAATTGDHADDNRILVLFGDGEGDFSPGLEFDPGFPPRSIVAGDFDGDGLPDIAASFFCGTEVKIVLNPLPPPGKAMVYVTNREDDTVSVIDPEINQVIDTVPVGHKPHGITLTPDGKEAYVANRNDDNVSVIKTGTTSGSNTEILRVSVGQKPEGITAANIPTKGTKVFVANRNDNTISVIDADPLSPFFHTVISTVSLPKPKNHKPVAIAFSPDGAFAYVAAEESHRLFVVDAKLAIDDPANAVLASVSVGKRPAALDVSSDGKIIYVANRGDSTVSKLATEAPAAPASPQVIATINVAQHPEGVAALPDGRSYVTSREANRVTVIDTGATPIASIPVGKHPLGIDILPSGGFAYVAEEGDDSVAVIDTSSNGVVAIIPVGKHPRGVAAGTVPTATQ